MCSALPVGKVSLCCAHERRERTEGKGKNERGREGKVGKHHFRIYSAEAGKVHIMASSVRLFPQNAHRLLLLTGSVQPLRHADARAHTHTHTPTQTVRGRGLQYICHAAAANERNLERQRPAAASWTRGLFTARCCARAVFHFTI